MQMNNTIALIMNLIKKEIFEYPLNNTVQLSETELNLLYETAKKHDITQILVSQLDELALLKPEYAISEKFRKALLMAVYRYERNNYGLKSICALFEENHIDYIALKGAVIRDYYPKPFLRTSCDIDILVKEEDVDKATQLLVNELNFRLDSKEQYDVSLFSPTGEHFELHFKLLEYGFKEVKTLQDIWLGNEIYESSPHCFKMSNELFLLFHIYHMAKHFIHGGCGIKSLIDLWIIKNKMGYDKEKAEAMLKGNDLYDFYVGVSNLADVWFSDKKHTHITKEIEEYILRGGVYGSLEQHLAMAQNKKGGKLKHLLSKIFLPYKLMLIYYPSLRKFPPLYPLYQVRRWFKILFFGGSHRAFREMQLSNNLSDIKKEKAKILINELGL